MFRSEIREIMEMVDFLLDQVDRRRRMSKAQRAKFRQMFKAEYRAWRIARKIQKGKERAMRKARRIQKSLKAELGKATKACLSAKKSRKSSWRAYFRQIRKYKRNNGLKRKLTKAEKR